ncbi:MAG TPA: trypsin-like peptidase domain-containing protein [Syntrophales bacterium]|nr:trypsin-like peptidase domain-containing protein [Syntrophales bacterium]HPI58457.1 trypsin-like peptidase domain-containing protein [Syntrophales bacterium]HPN25957.1 trypsin-like peptidase domain-containing protein [Syntrophales bacterium]HQM28795.1 trypsin-like peptidase domain-containing protein [Syntrophales bacterium]
MKTKGFHFILLSALLFAGACAGVTSTRETPVVHVIKQNAAVVVNLRTESIVDLKEHPQWGRYGEQLDRYFKQYFGENYSKGTLKLKSLGSGVIISDKGLIVTNAHVVQRASSIYVVFRDGTVSEGRIARVSTVDDLAVIRADIRQPVRQVKIADMKDLMIGETVIAIGNPLGLENSVTVGVLSGVNRVFKNLECEYECQGLLQIDAPINPGNSGGALFNADGELVGINLAVVAGAQNIGFAVPAGRVMRLLEEIEKEK